MGGRRCVADCRSSCCTFSRTATIPRLTPRSWAGSAMASILRAVPPLQPSLNPDRHRGDVGPAPRTLHVRNLQRLQELHERPLEVGGESRAPRVPGVVVTRDPGIEKEELRLVGPPNRRRTWRLTVGSHRTILVGAGKVGIRHEADVLGVEDVASAVEPWRTTLLRLQEVSEGGHGAVVEVRRSSPDSIQRDVDVAIGLQERSELEPGTGVVAVQCTRQLLGELDRERLEARRISANGFKRGDLSGLRAPFAVTFDAQPLEDGPTTRDERRIQIAPIVRFPQILDIPLDLPETERVQGVRLRPNSKGRAENG